MTRLLAAAIATALAAGTAISSPASAGEARLGAITVEKAWSRAGLAGVDNGAAYMTLRNDGDTTDHLVAAATPAAKGSSLHESSMEDGAMQMKPVARVAVEPDAPTVFEPGGLHVMLMGLKRPIEEGGSFPLTLTFERAGEVTVTVDVLALDATADDLPAEDM